MAVFSCGTGFALHRPEGGIMRHFTLRAIVMLGGLTLAGTAAGEGRVQVARPDLVCTIKVTTDQAGQHPVAANSEQSGPVWVRVTMKNQGLAATENTFYAFAAVSAPGHDPYSAAPMISLAAGGAHVLGPVQIGPKANLTYTVRGIADWPGFSNNGGRVKESNENNNECTFVFKGPKLN